MKKVFVTGASGLLGKTLINNLIDNGFEVIALMHSTDINNRNGLTVIKGDVTNTESFYEYMQSVDVIFHLAGVVTDWSPKKLYYDVHVNGTKNIIEAAIKYKINKVIYISTIDIFAHEKFNIINESTPYTSSTNYYRESKLMAHKLIVEKTLNSNVKTIILCPSWIYGPGDKIFISEISKQLKSNNFMFIGKKTNYVPLIFADNLCKLMIDISKKDINSNYETFIVSDINIRWDILIKKICDKIGSKYPKISLPYHLAFFVGMLMEFYGIILKIKKRPLLTRAAVEVTGRSIEVDARKIFKFIGYVPKTTIDDGLNETLNSVTL